MGGGSTTNSVCSSDMNPDPMSDNLDSDHADRLDLTPKATQPFSIHRVRYSATY